MKRLVNVRLPVVFACALTAGVALGFLFIFYNISLLWVIVTVPAVAIIFIFSVIFSKTKMLPAIIVITAVFFILGAVNCFLRLDGYGKSQLIYGTQCEVSATVCEKGKTSYGEYIIVNNVSAGSKKINGKIIVYLGETYGDFCDDGYKVTFCAVIKKLDSFPYGKLNYLAEQNIKYSCSVNGGLSARYRFSLFGSVRSAIRRTLYDNLDSDTASIAFAMLTGNTQQIDSGVLTNMRFGGIAHIFAVSGLHIGIIYGLIYCILKKLRINKYLFAVVCLLPIIFYAGVCGFTLSSLRAVIMCAVSVLAGLFNKKYDALNALAVSAFLILLITPLSLFSVGFQLSICAVAGLILLAKNIVRPFKKVPYKLKSAVAVPLSAQAGTLPVMLINFGYLSGAGLILNILIVPILSALFLLTFICTLIAVIFPFCAVAVVFGVLPLEAVISFLQNTGFENSLISGFGAGAFALFYYPALFALSDKFNLKILHRMIAFSCAFTMLFAYVFLRSFIPFGGFKVYVGAYYGGGEVLIKSKDGNVLIITEKLNFSHTQIFLNNTYTTKLDAVIILGGENCVTAFNSLDVNCKHVYVFDGYIGVQPYRDIIINYESDFALAGVGFEFSDGYSISAKLGNNKIAVCAGENILFDNYDLLITDAVCDNAIGFNQRALKNNVYDCGEMNFYFR